LPAARLLASATANAPGANPAEALIRCTFDWTLRLLCLALAVTPLRQGLDLPALARFRRKLGLFAFFYSVLHFLSYAWRDMGFELNAIVRNTPKHPFAPVGLLALLRTLPLAATLFNRAIKALGAAHWQALHPMVYAIALLGSLHFCINLCGSGVGGCVSGLGKRRHQGRPRRLRAHLHLLGRDVHLHVGLGIDLAHGLGDGAGAMTAADGGNLELEHRSAPVLDRPCADDRPCPRGKVKPP
jgi:DMSO/TMAO reductase YedYZ heme-binding membrane subunit